MLKVGIIGCGAMGSLHATCWLALPEHAELVAIADVDGKKAEEIIKKHPNIKLYSTGEELLEAENELDVIDICVPTFLHTKYAVDAMKKVKNVFIEKPVCLNEQEAELLLKNTGGNRRKSTNRSGCSLHEGVCLAQRCCR